jgi:hypothetical protein
MDRVTARATAVVGGVIGSLLAGYYAFVMFLYRPGQRVVIDNGTHVPTFFELHFGSIFLLVICGAVGFGFVGAFLFTRKLLRKFLPRT